MKKQNGNKLLLPISKTKKSASNSAKSSQVTLPDLRTAMDSNNEKLGISSRNYD